MLLIYMHVTIDPPSLRPVNHCFTTCTGRTSRTSRVKPFTSLIRSTVLDKDEKSRAKFRKVEHQGSLEKEAKDNSEMPDWI